MDKQKVSSKKSYLIRDKRSADRFGIVYVISTGFLGDESVTISTDDKISLGINHIANKYISVNISNWIWEEVES